MDVQQFQNVEHADTIHHVEFDFHGRRVATASSDKIVCIWDKVPTTTYSGAAAETPTGTAWVRTAYWKVLGLYLAAVTHYFLDAWRGCLEGTMGAFRIRTGDSDLLLRQHYSHLR